MVSAALLNSTISLLDAFPFEVSERLILVLLAWRADENGETRLSKADLERQSGLSQPTLRKNLGRLELMGLVSGRRIRLEVPALTRLLLAKETTPKSETAFQTDGGEKVKPSFSRKTENGFQDLGDSGLKDGFSFDRKQVSEKSETVFHPYRLETKDTLNSRERAGACAREGLTPPEETRARSPETGRSEAARIQDAEAFAAFLREYPKRSMARATVAGLWAALEAEGVPGRRLLGAMREAAATKQWLEEAGRFVPRAENWLRDRGFEQFLREADRRAAVPTQAEREAAEAARARERMAVDEEVLAMMEDEDGDHV